MYLKTQGLVLRVTEYQEADCLLTVLSREHGLMSLKARGVRRKSSNLKGACQLLTYSEFTIFENRGFSTINEAEALEMFTGLRGDIELLSLGSYFAQVAEVLSQEDLPNPELLALTLNALYALCKLNRPQPLVKAAFELRIACLAGYAPMLDGCAVCGNPTPDRFDVRGGTLQCAGCAGQQGSLRLPLSGGALSAMRHIACCERQKLFSFSLGTDAQKELSDVAETYLVTQLERGFFTLDFYKSLRLI